ncbi:caspase-14-like isoform X1 [Hypanus sabinus]|uniref:caspase-14-like isoform X1 n=2 Tax=Hypanus sabinus TaxID=79690 RepID=UPI0028C432EA|nr:caspase-14-like isoform X1 [Hypanus sabinus]
MSAEVDSRASESPRQGNEVSSSPRASGPQDQDDRYNMSGVRKAFIICVTEGRPGAKTDLINLQKSLQSLGFEVSECINPTSEEIFSSLEEYRDSIKDEVCCSFVFILAHGSEGKVMGRDREEADLEEIFDMFNNEECLHLQQKPKVFVIQACRGDNKDRGAVSAGFRALSEKLPMVSDTFVVYPSRPGYVAYRHTDQGSYMITFMTEVFKSHGNQEHLYDLFVRVNRRMVTERYKTYKTTVVMESTLTKAVYLKPT